jgi:hypothetical protein
MPPSLLRLSRYPTRTPSAGSGHLLTRTLRPAGRSGPFRAAQRWPEPSGASSRAKLELALAASVNCLKLGTWGRRVECLIGLDRGLASVE